MQLSFAPEAKCPPTNLDDLLENLMRVSEFFKFGKETEIFLPVRQNEYIDSFILFSRVERVEILETGEGRRKDSDQ